MFYSSVRRGVALKKSPMAVVSGCLAFTRPPGGRLLAIVRQAASVKSRSTQVTLGFHRAVTTAPGIPI
jgi:hypothetical protein